MRVTTLAILAAFSICSLAAQAGPREDAEARAALDLALALQRSSPAPQPVAAHKAERMSFADAYAVALRDGKALVIHVNDFDCKDACKECLATGECRACNAAEVGGDSTQRMILAYPSRGRLYKAAEWRRVPSAAEVKAELAKICAGGSCTTSR